jgi:diguanylate cyclase (GGDEF)-like protein
VYYCRIKARRITLFMPRNNAQPCPPCRLRTILPAALVLLFALATAGHAQDEIQRHALETEALTRPKAVLAELPALVNAAKSDADNSQLALLLMAQSNACRVIADWQCQKESAVNAGLAAKAAGNPHLQTRALISQGRASMAMQAYSAAEQTMGEAEQLLQQSPSASLLADVMLAYSSLSYSLNNHELSVDYADRGLAALAQRPALSIRIRLIRNKARALSALGDEASSLEMLKTALVLSAQLKDPKLSAELYLEQARIAREQKDVATQRDIGQRVLALADQLDNDQIRGLGHEVLGYAAQNAGNSAAAINALDKALAYFRKVDLQRDERRALRELLQIEIAQKRPAEALRAKASRLITLEQQLEIDDRKLVSNSLNAQLQYAQQKIDLETLKVNAALASEKAEAAESRQRATLITAFLSICLLISLGVFSVFQRRNAQRLQQANNELRLAEAKLAEMARVDSLSGVANRRHFDEALPASLARMRREGRQAALLCLDIDHFKSINDNYGHPVGDTVIVAVAERLGQCIREVDLLARLGGDEFVILIENASPGSAETIAEKILTAMQQPITVDGHALQVGTSIGVAYHREGTSDADFFMRADQALYEAKKAGRNRLHAVPA